MEWPFVRRAHDEPPGRLRAWTRRLASAALVAVIGYLAFALWLDEYGRGRRPDVGADAIIVLGCRVTADGRASSALEMRARRAAELYRRGVAPQIVVTGGVGDHAPSEAEAARRVLVDVGVPSAAIVLEEASTSTEENLAFARGRTEARRVVVVSDAYHVFRAERTARKYFDEVSAAGAISTTETRVHGALREVIAVVGYAALGRLRSLDGAPPPEGRSPRTDLVCLPPAWERRRSTGRARRPRLFRCRREVDHG